MLSEHPKRREPLKPTLVAACLAAFVVSFAAGPVSQASAARIEVAPAVYVASYAAYGSLGADYLPVPDAVTAPSSPPAPAAAAPARAPAPVAVQRTPAPAPAAPGAGSTVVASYFGPGLYGNRTACGQTLTATLMGVAHRTLPCGTSVTLRYGSATVTVPVVDRGPWNYAREFDLTYATKVALGCPDICRLAWLH